MKDMKKIPLYYEENKTCKCGHVYLDHFNPKTGKEWGCFWEYNCGCKKFELDRRKIMINQPLQLKEKRKPTACPVWSDLRNISGSTNM